MVTQDFQHKTKELIDGLKGVCASYGLGNDGNEFKCNSLNLIRHSVKLFN